MEGLFGILVGLVFLISTILNAVKKFSEESVERAENKEIDKKINEMYAEKTDKVKKPDRFELYGDTGKAGQQTEKTTTMPELILQSIDNPYRRDEYNNTGLKELKDREVVEDDEKDSVRDKLFMPARSDFSEEEIIKGFIFKEILDRPRAKRPYQPPYLRK